AGGLGELSGEFRPVVGVFGLHFELGNNEDHFYSPSSVLVLPLIIVCSSSRRCWEISSRTRFSTASSIVSPKIHVRPPDLVSTTNAVTERTVLRMRSPTAARRRGDLPRSRRAGGTRSRHHGRSNRVTNGESTTIAARNNAAARSATPVAMWASISFPAQALLRARP